MFGGQNKAAQQPKTLGIATSSGYIAQRQLSTTSMADPPKQPSPRNKVEPVEQEPEEIKVKVKAKQAVEPESPDESKPTVTTTAGGDGLSLTVGQPNIFQLIEALKEGRDLLQEQEAKNQGE